MSINYKSLFQNAIDANLIVDCETGMIIEANKMAQNYFQMSHSDLMNTYFASLFEDDYDYTNRSEIIDDLSLGDNVVVRKHIDNNGHLLYFEMLISIIEWDDTTALFASLRNITERRKTQDDLKEAYIKMEEISRIDPLTQISNRRALKESLNYEVKRFERNKENFSLILSDIDYYKQINDTYGHDAGDFVLVEISKLLVDTLRQQDIVGRWGGDEFLIILPQTEIQGALVLGEKLRKNIADKSFDFNDQIIQLTMTFGVSEFSEGYDYSKCITNADYALYKAKEAGKNKVLISE